MKLGRLFQRKFYKVSDQNGVGFAVVEDLDALEWAQRAFKELEKGIPRIEAISRKAFHEFIQQHRGTINVDAF